MTIKLIITACQLSIGPALDLQSMPSQLVSRKASIEIRLNKVPRAILVTQEQVNRGLKVKQINNCK